MPRRPPTDTSPAPARAPAHAVGPSWPALHRRAITPVQIFEHQHQGGVGREHLQRLANSRSIRTAVAPSTRRCTRSNSSRVPAPKLHQPQRRIALQHHAVPTRQPMPGPLQGRIAAGRVRLRRSVPHIARGRSALPGARRARNRSTTVVLPMPSSPLTNELRITASGTADTTDGAGRLRAGARRRVRRFGGAA